LARIAELERSAETINDVGERLTSQSLGRVDNAAATERLVLVSLLAGLAMAGVALAVVTGRVIRQVQQLHSQEQDARMQLASALQSRTDFIADASHELRTPLTMIRGNAEIGIARPGESIHLQVLGEILSEANRMNRLVNDLLFLAQSDAGMPSIEREYLPVRWLLERLKPAAETLARSHDRCLTADLNGTGHLEIDAERIEQAVLIAIDNAAKHAPAETCISLHSHSRGQELVIEILDQGPGIPPEQIPLLFDRFYQVGTRRTRKRGGAGLGLSIARSIVESHGGSITIESREGRGTRVAIRLPLSAEET
jgi:signal transduction histidine kinase